MHCTLYIVQFTYMVPCDKWSFSVHCTVYPRSLLNVLAQILLWSRPLPPPLSQIQHGFNARSFLYFNFGKITKKIRGSRFQANFEQIKAAIAKVWTLLCFLLLIFSFVKVLNFQRLFVHNAQVQQRQVAQSSSAKFPRLRRKSV